MKKIFLVIGMLFSSMTIDASYTVGALDTTANGGTGYGNATPSSAPGYIVQSISAAADLGWGSAVQPDGKTVVVGQSATTAQMAIARFNVNGTLDTTFASSVGYEVIALTGVTLSNANAVTVLPNGKIVIVGSGTSGGVIKAIVVQLLSSGVLDASFGGGTGFVAQRITTTSTVDIAYAVAVDNSGNIYAVGTSVDTKTNIFIAQYTSAGVLGSSYNTSHTTIGTGTVATAPATGIALICMGAADVLAGSGAAIIPAGLTNAGNLVIVGSDTTTSSMLVAELTSAGVAASFGTGGVVTTNLGASGIGYAVGFQSSGKVIAVGSTNITTGFVAVARFTTAGVLDPSFGVAASGYNITNNFGGYTGAYARGVAIQSDDKVVIGGTAVKATATLSDLAIARYLADGSALDTSNFASPNGYTTTDIPSNTVNLGNSLALQQNGSFIVAGTTSATDFVAARYLGTQFVQGAMDLTYDALNGATGSANQGFALYPTDTTDTDMPKVVAIYPLSGSSAGNLYVLSSTNTPTNSQLVQIGSSGAVAQAQVTIAQPTPTDVIADSENRAIVIGTTAGAAGFIARYTHTSGMVIDSTFNSGAIKTETLNSSSFIRVGEQTNGRIVVAGQGTTSTAGLLIAYNENGVLATSSQTVCAGFGTGGPSSYTGFITFAGATINDMIIDANNYIYVVYTDGSNNRWIAKYLPDGSALAPNFGSVGGTPMNIGFGAATYFPPCLSFDAAGTPNIIVAASGGTPGISFQRYAPTATSVPLTTTITNATTLLTGNPDITKIQCDTNNRIIFSGFDGNDFFVGRMTAGTFTPDITFAPYSNYPGIMKTMYSTNNPSRVSNSVAISSYNTGTSSNNGAILFGGYENVTGGASTVALVGQADAWTSGTVYTQVKRFPGSLLDGTINTSYGTNGALNLNTAPVSLPAGQAKAINVITVGAQAGKMLVADSNGTTTTLAMLDATGAALDANAFGTGVSSVSLSSILTAAAIMVDTTGLIYYVVGTNGTVKSVTYGAATVTTFAASALTSAYGIAQQASGRILVAGYNSASSVGGVVVAYTPAGVIDTSFNSDGTGGPGALHVSGYWYTGSNNPIVGISVGTQTAVKDRIYIAYASAASAANGVVQQILENGTSYAPTSGTGAFSPIAAFGGTVNGNTQLKMKLDVNGKIILAAATSATPSALSAARYTSVGAVDVAAAVIVPALANQTIQNLLTLSDGTTLILGAVPNATPASASVTVARLTSGALIDSSFNPLGTPGYLTTTMPASSAVMSDFYALDVVTTGGILVSGDNSPTASTANPYLSKIIQSEIVTKISQSATALGAAGALDTTFNPAGVNPGFMNMRTEVTSGFVVTTAVKALLQQTNGSYFVAGATTAASSYVTLMTDDDVQVSTFGTSGLLTIALPNASCMLLSQAGTLLVAGGAGTSASHAGWLKSYSATLGTATSGFAGPTGGGSTGLDAIYAIAQQTNGRILVAGSSAGVGTIAAYNSVTGAVDTTFGVNGFYTLASSGPIYTMIVGSNDNIYFMANISTTGYVKQLSANGTGTPITGAYTLTSNLATSNRLAFDQNNNIIVVSISSVPGSIVIARFDGTNISNTALVVPTIFAITGVTTANITSVLVDLNANPGKVVITGYDSAASPNTPFVARIVSALTGLDTTFNTTGVQLYNTIGASVTTQWYSGMINADGKITVGGYASGPTNPYLMRVYGDEFIGQYSPSLTPLTAGVPGTINTNFASSGFLSLIGTADTAGIPKVILPASNGYQYVAFDTRTLVRYTNAATPTLDLTYGTGGYADLSNAGVYSMSMIGNGGLILAGTTGGAGWINQYTTAGTLDTSFSTDGIISLGAGTVATVAVQQSLSRIVVAGQLASSGNGALWGFTNTGVADATFAVGSVAGTGILDTGLASTVIYAMVADQYDRLIIAYKSDSTVALRRYTSSGELDTTFGSGGTIASAIPSLVDDATQVKVALNAAGNIVIAAHLSTPSIAVVAYANTTGTTVTQAQLSFTSIITPVLTGLITTSDGKVLVSGNSLTSTYQMWVARVVGSGTYALDTTTFNPAGTAGGTTGIMQFNAGSAATVSARNLTSIAIYGDGEISLLGTETRTTAAVNNPFMSRAYNAPYVTQQAVDLDAVAPGIVDTTLGAGVSPNYVANGITFLATASGTGDQVARAVALQNGNNNGVVVALDGTSSLISASGPSNIYINMFDVDGLLNTSFNPSATSPVAPGQAVVLSMFNNQYVNDMVTFTTAAGISKAILAGYAQNTSPGLTGSLLIQYILTAASPALDSGFGGFNGNSLGVAFGDGQKFNTVGLQSNGRIIAGGLNQSPNGSLFGYTAAGNLDASFGQGGTFVQGTTGIYTSAIDSYDRVVVAYNVGGTLTLARILADGSGLDTTFGVAATGIVTTTITGLISNSNLRLVIDGPGNIAVAAVTTGLGTGITVARYTTGGVLSTAISTTIGSTMSLTQFTITKMLVDANGALVLVGYDNAASDMMVIARLVYSSTTYILDTTFNATAGFVKYEVNSTTTQISTGAFIHPDGRIIIGGAQQ